MDWVPLTDYENGINLNDRPRRLTEEELTYITAHLPTAPSADSTAAEVARQGIIEWMLETLKEVNLAPSAIPGLIRRMVDQHHRSLVVPGTPVGITAAEAVGATTTQMTLNTFHSSGSAKSASFGIDAMRDLIFARKTPKNESCTIYFTNKTATYEEVLNSRQYIVGSVVANFVKDYDIDGPDVLQRYWWHDQAELLLEKKIPESTKVLRLFLNVAEMYKHKVSIKDLAEVLEREIPPSAVAIYGPIADGIIDIYPHPAIIAETLKKGKENAIPPELAEVTYLETVVRPELKNIRVKGIAGIRSLVPVISPIWRIVLLERKMVEADITNELARPILGPHIANGSGWFLYYNPIMVKTTGLSPENLAALCQLAGITIIGGNEHYLGISMPNDRFRTSSGEVVIELNGIKYRQIENDLILRRDDVIYREIAGTLLKETPAGWTEQIEDKVFTEIPPADVYRVNEKFYRRIPTEQFVQAAGFSYEQITDGRVRITEMKPSEYVMARVTADKRTRNAEIKRLTDENIKAAQDLPEEQRKDLIRRPVDVPRTQLMIASEFVIAETEGSNLKELMALPNIDKTRTTCNNMYTIAATLGIEAARTFVIRALNNTISNTGSYVHPMNIMFIAEFITSRGEPYGATYTGISRQPGGHLSLATLERAGKVFTQSALHGRKEDIRNVSASIAMGARMAIGDGAFDIAQDIVQNGVPKTIINDDLFTALDEDDATKQLATQRGVVPAPAATIALEDLAGGIDLIKTITLGGTFDYTGAEDETNLITAFNPGEIIADVATTRPIQPETAQKVVRRVQAQAIHPRTPPAKVDVPRELVDVLTQIKIGVPIPEREGAETERITIRPLETGVVIAAPAPEPVVSTGLIPLAELIPKTIETGVPEGLEALLLRYRTEIEGGPVIPALIPPIEPVAIVEELPRVEIPQLPDITGVALTRTMRDLRREQVRELELIDTAALQTTLTK